MVYIIGEIACDRYFPRFLGYAAAQMASFGRFRNHRRRKKKTLKNMSHPQAPSDFTERRCPSESLASGSWQLVGKEETPDPLLLPIVSSCVISSTVVSVLMTGTVGGFIISLLGGGSLTGLVALAGWTSKSAIAFPSLARSLRPTGRTRNFFTSDF